MSLNDKKNLESNDSALLVFGNGDGGGGALPKMLENVCARRQLHIPFDTSTASPDPRNKQ